MLVIFMPYTSTTYNQPIVFCFTKDYQNTEDIKKNNNNLNKTQDNIHDKNMKPMRHTLTHACVFYTVYGTVQQKVLQSQSSDFKFYKGKIGRDWRTYMLRVSVHVHQIFGFSDSLNQKQVRIYI